MGEPTTVGADESGNWTWDDVMNRVLGIAITKKYIDLAGLPVWFEAAPTVESTAFLEDWRNNINTRGSVVNHSQSGGRLINVKPVNKWAANRTGDFTAWDKGNRQGIEALRAGKPLGHRSFLVATNTLARIEDALPKFATTITGLTKSIGADAALSGAAADAMSNLLSELSKDMEDLKADMSTPSSWADALGKAAISVATFSNAVADAFAAFLKEPYYNPGNLVSAVLTAIEKAANGTQPQTVNGQDTWMVTVTTPVNLNTFDMASPAAWANADKTVREHWLKLVTEKLTNPVSAATTSLITSFRNTNQTLGGGLTAYSPGSTSVPDPSTIKNGDVGSTGLPGADSGGPSGAFNTQDGPNANGLNGDFNSPGGGSDGPLSGEFSLGNIPDPNLNGASNGNLGLNTPPIGEFKIGEGGAGSPLSFGNGAASAPFVPPVLSSGGGGTSGAFKTDDRGFAVGAGTGFGSPGDEIAASMVPTAVDGKDVGALGGANASVPAELTGAAGLAGQTANAGAGYPPMYPPMGGMGGMGGGGAGQGRERERNTFLSEDEQVWGTDPDCAPAVIGRGGQVVPGERVSSEQSDQRVPARPDTSRTRTTRRMQ